MIIKMLSENLKKQIENINPTFFSYNFVFK